jgi:hypothetical protein
MQNKSPTQPPKLPPFTWHSHDSSFPITPETHTGSSDVGIAQQRIMCALLKMLHLKLKESSIDPREKDIYDFAHNYSIEEQCFGFTEIFKSHSRWLVQLWRGLSYWDGDDLKTLRHNLEKSLKGLRRVDSDDVLDEAILLMREGFEKQQSQYFSDSENEKEDEESPCKIPPSVPVVIAKTSDSEFRSVAQVTGTMNRKTLAAEIKSTHEVAVENEITSYLLEISSGSHSTICGYKEGVHVVFEPDNREAFKETKDHTEVADFVWDGLSSTSAHKDQSHASIDLDMMIDEELFQMLSLGDENLRSKSAQELAEYTLKHGISQDLFQIFLYNPEMTEYVFNIIANNLDEYKPKLMEVHDSMGPGGESGREVLEHLVKDYDLLVCIFSVNNVSNSPKVMSGKALDSDELYLG